MYPCAKIEHKEFFLGPGCFKDYLDAEMVWFDCLFS